MIITCPCGDKKFKIDATLIPDDGRNLECGSCGHVWFFKKEQKKIFEEPKIDRIDDKLDPKTNIETKKKINKVSKKIYKSSLNEKKSSELIEYKSESKFTFSNFLAYIIVFIISFISLIILIDTFRTPLYNLFPSLEIILFNFYEVLKDVQLFIKDLL